jgi:hypothetical protein
MPRPSRLPLAKSEIFAHFTKVGPRAYAKAELNQILTNHTGKWRLVKSTNVNDFITFLQKSGGIKTYEFHADAYDNYSLCLGFCLTVCPRAFS